MNFYIFSQKIDEVQELKNHHYSGILLIYSNSLTDFFTQIARTMVVNEDFKYMVAVRPYAISPQYLFRINDSINNIDKNRLKINIVSGAPDNNKFHSGGVLGEVNDDSSPLEKSNYLIKYVDLLENPNKNIPDYYVSVRNKSMVDETMRHNSKLLISYEDYRDKVYNTENRDVMIHIWVILRETKEELRRLRNEYSKKIPGPIAPNYLTHKEFEDILTELKNKKINEFLFYTFWDKKERTIINNFVKKYKEKELIGKK
jgi:hypothetical protein